jgi:hypothetical protein
MLQVNLQEINIFTHLYIDSALMLEACRGFQATQFQAVVHD